MAFLQKANSGTLATASNSLNTNPFGANVTPGSALLGWVTWGSPNTAPSTVTINGQAATPIGTPIQDGPNSQNAQWFYVLNATGGTNTGGTVTFGASTLFVGMIVIEESAIATSSALDVGAGPGVIFVTPAAATGTTSSFTTSQAGDLIAVGFVDSSGTTTAIGTPSATNSSLTNRDSTGSGIIEMAVATGLQSTAGSTSATWTWTTNANALIVALALKAAAPGSPTITTTSSATPRQDSQLTITGASFGASPGTVAIGGVAQTVLSWSDSLIVVLVARGTKKFGAALNVVVTTSGAVDSNAYALTGLLPRADWSYVDVATPASSSLRLTSTPDLASGDQISWCTVGGGVVVADDGSFSAAPYVTQFRFEVWSTGGGWGTAALQQVAAPRGAWAGYYARGGSAHDVVRSIAIMPTSKAAVSFVGDAIFGGTFSGLSQTVNAGGNLERERAGGFAAAAGSVSLAVGGNVEREAAGGAVITAGPVTVAPGGSLERETAGGAAVAPGAVSLAVGGGLEREAAGGLSAAIGAVTPAALAELDRQKAGGPRYVPNPGAQWGPGSRASAAKAEAKAEAAAKLKGAS